MPRCLRLLLHKNLLERTARLEGNRHGPEDQVPVGHQGGSQAHGDTQAAGAKGHRHQTSEGEWASLPAELPRLLYQEWEAGLRWHTGQVRLSLFDSECINAARLSGGNDRSLLFGDTFHGDTLTQLKNRKWMCAHQGCWLRWSATLCGGPV